MNPRCTQLSVGREQALQRLRPETLRRWCERAGPPGRDRVRINNTYQVPNLNTVSPARVRFNEKPCSHVTHLCESLTSVMGDTSQKPGYKYSRVRAGQASGGYCQCVLDAAFHTVEWPHQPLQFESAALRGLTRRRLGFPIVPKWPSVTADMRIQIDNPNGQVIILAWCDRLR